MINTHALTNPSPADGNLRTGMDRLGMLREGNYDSNRFSYFHGNFNTHNRTDRMLNSKGGNHHTSNTNIFSGGIVTFPIPISQAHHPVPVKNALIDAPVIPYDLYHTPLAPQFNPIALK